jgi:tetratricopeptide (TPR) repeat protein
MTLIRTASAVAIVLASWSMMFVSRAAADQETLARAKALYTSASYDEALALLNQFDNATPSEMVEVDQYRALCLFALGRSDDARKVIQQLVEANPSFQPSETQVSPRLQEVFRDVRRRVLPSIVRSSYAEAKAAFERKEFDVATNKFDIVVTLLNDIDAAGSGELSDLRILSNGFLDLIKTMPSPVVEAAPATPASPTPEPPPTRTIFGLEDTDVTPPVAISQEMPPWRPGRQETQTYEATLILVINASGDVTSVTLHGNLQPSYDALLRRAASQWKFRPAMRNGQPVEFRKIVAVRLTPLT